MHSAFFYFWDWPGNDILQSVDRSFIRHLAWLTSHWFVAVVSTRAASADYLVAFRISEGAQVAALSAHPTLCRVRRVVPRAGETPSTVVHFADGSLQTLLIVCCPHGLLC